VLSSGVIIFADPFLPANLLYKKIHPIIFFRNCKLTEKKENYIRSKGQVSIPLP